MYSGHSHLLQASLMILPLITTLIKHQATQRLETNFISFYEEMSKIKQKKYQLFLVEALGIEPRSEEEPHPASTCLSHLLVVAVITPIGRIFTASLLNISSACVTSTTCRQARLAHAPQKPNGRGFWRRRCSN